MTHKLNTATRYSLQAIRPDGTTEIFGWTARKTKSALANAIDEWLPESFRVDALQSIPESEDPKIQKYGHSYAMILSSGFMIKIGETALEINGYSNTLSNL